MLARLILALLLAAFAVPGAAPAACHDTTVRHHSIPMPGHVSDDHALPMHGCIGCIPPSDWLSPRLALLLPSPVPAPVGPISPPLTGASPAPDLPPPRRG